MSFITIDNSCHGKAHIINSNIYGSSFEYFEANDAISTTLIMNKSGTGVVGGYSALTASTSYKLLGLYKISYCYSWTNNSESRDFCAVVLLDGVIKFQTRSSVITNSGGNDTDDFAISNSGNNQRHNTSGWFYTSLAGNHSINLIFGRGNTGTGSDSVSISDIKLDILRIS